MVTAAFKERENSASALRSMNASPSTRLSPQLLRQAPSRTVSREDARRCGLVTLARAIRRGEKDSRSNDHGCPSMKRTAGDEGREGRRDSVVVTGHGRESTPE